MPWSGGVYTRGIPSWVADANNAIPISATRFDTEDNDFASGLNNAITIDGLNKPNATLNWAVQMNWTRASDGNIWSLARTSGSNNPKIQASVTDASGVTLAVTGGGLTATSTGAISVTSSSTLALSSTNFTVAAGGDTTARGVAICKFKAGNTSRASTTVLAADPDLSYAVPASGTYALRAVIYVGRTGAGGGGYVLSPEFTGTSTTANWLGYGTGSGNVFTGMPSFLAFGTPNTGFGGVDASGDYHTVEGTLVATSSGTLAIFWAQKSSSTDNTIFQAGSYMTVTQLS